MYLCSICRMEDYCCSTTSSTEEQWRRPNIWSTETEKSNIPCDEVADDTFFTRLKKKKHQLPAVRSLLIDRCSGNLIPSLCFEPFVHSRLWQRQRSKERAPSGGTSEAQKTCSETVAKQEKKQHPINSILFARNVTRGLHFL